MIDKIYKLYSDYILKYGVNENDLNFSVFTNLLEFIRAGKYTERRSKKIILDHWMTHNNKELADLLEVTVSSISYAKKNICLDLKQSLGGTLISLVENKQFKEISQLLMVENDYLDYETIIPSCLVKEINALYESKITIDEDWKQKAIIADKELVNDLSNKTAVISTETLQLLQFTQHHFFPNVADLIKDFDIYRLKQIMDILHGNNDTAEMRHNLLNYLIDTPSVWEQEVRDYLKFKFYESL